MNQRADAIRKQVIIALVLTAAIGANVLTGLASYYLGYQMGFIDGARDAYNPINLGANAVQFSSSELQAFESIKNRVYVYNTDPHLLVNATFSGSRCATQQAMTITKNQWSTYASGAVKEQTVNGKRL